MNNFGLAYIKGEGKPYHPDFFENNDFSDEVYLRLLKAYAECYGVEHTKNIMCVRPELLDKLLKGELK